ncbi:MAG: hypothetical protein QM733_00610 [Ilumatobacteraceae bacterium]
MTNRSSRASSAHASSNASTVAVERVDDGGRRDARVLLEVLDHVAPAGLHEAIDGTGEVADEGVDVVLAARRRVTELVGRDGPRRDCGEPEGGAQLWPNVGQRCRCGGSLHLALGGHAGVGVVGGDGLGGHGDDGTEMNRPSSVRF